jgi:RNA-directed DNA polymerase
VGFIVILELIARDLGIPASYVGTLAKTASHRYFHFTIRKKSGGTRDIYHPSRELKLVQRWIARNVFDRLPIHASAYGYRKGMNIAQHAKIHSGNNFLLKVDFAEFFPSIRASDVVETLRRNAHLFRGAISSESDYETIQRLVCRQGSLTIGAPSSPTISNTVMFEFDKDWAERCEAEGIAYSRYADDLCFSTNHRNLLADLLVQVRADIARRDSPRLQLNDAKTVFTSRKRLRLVTGLVLTSTKRVSVGRARKRRVKSLVYRYSRNLLSDEEKASLRGDLSFIRSVEPSFIEALTKKYGTNFLSPIGL